MKRRLVALALVTSYACLISTTSTACRVAPAKPAAPGDRWPTPGHVLHIILEWSREGSVGLEVVRTESWQLIDAGGKIAFARTRTYDAAGRLESESAFEGAHMVAHHIVYGPPEHRWTASAGPRAHEPLMWTEHSIQEQLLGRGFRVKGQAVIAGLSATVYERRQPFLPGLPPTPSPPTAAPTVAPVTPTQATAPPIPSPVPAVPQARLRTTVRRVYVGREPLGLDLGEETGHEDDAGTFHLAMYRKPLRYEVLRPEAVPADVFQWPPTAPPAAEPAPGRAGQPNSE
jgi:hypothetical protein